MLPLNVLIACEESQTECSTFLAAGCNAYSCDLQECSGNFPNRHIVEDVRSLFIPGSFVKTQDGLPLCVPQWDLIIAHPPCTYLSRAAGAYLYRGHQVNEERFLKGQEAAQFFMQLLNAPARFVAVENPVPFKVFNLPPPSCAIDPYDFGAPWSKRTLLWLRNLPPLFLTLENPSRSSWVHCTRGGKKRSKSFPCIAQAMADQWLPFILQTLNIEPKFT